MINFKEKKKNEIHALLWRTRSIKSKPSFKCVSDRNRRQKKRKEGQSHFSSAKNEFSSNMLFFHMFSSEYFAPLKAHGLILVQTRVPILFFFSKYRSKCYHFYLIYTHKIVKINKIIFNDICYLIYNFISAISRCTKMNINALK
jgi:hypothetical protein